MAFPCPPFLVCREQTPASKTFPEFLRGNLNSCSSGKGEDAETKEEQPGNNSAALGQSPGSASRDTRNSIFKLSTERERGATPCPRSGAATESASLRRHRSSLKELPHARGQGWQPRGATPCPRSGSCVGTGGPRGATPRSRSGGVTVRRYPSSKVRSSSCALLEQPWRDTPRPR